MDSSKLEHELPDLLKLSAEMNQMAMDAMEERKKAKDKALEELEEDVQASYLIICICIVVILVLIFVLEKTLKVCL